MAVSKAAAEMLGARAIGHDDLGLSVPLPTGLRKTSRGLIAPHAHLDDDDRRDEPDDEPVSEPPEPEPPPKRKAKRRTDVQEKAEPKAVRTTVAVAGFGSIPTQYAHIYKGYGVIVLGLTDLSFQPEPATLVDGKPTNVIELGADPGTKYIYCDNWFLDDDNIKNIILGEYRE